jgi:hypothetical protein
MYPIIKAANVKMYDPMSGKTVNRITNICQAHNGRLIIYHADAYYYLNSNNTISRRQYKEMQI